ncbi:MAG: hypothetical protein HOG41_21085 [Gammaproteobacteria bacterium]|nr:hypothetical protein [Gammaproteobacteria bacterium]
MNISTLFKIFFNLFLVFILSACSEADSVNVTVSAPAPTVSLSASPESITSGESTTINWTSTDASECTASGDWSGSRNTSGSQTFTSLTADSTFNLNCSGAGGSVSGTATITVSSVVGGSAICGANSSCIEVKSYDCNLSNVHCVGSNQEFSTIQNGVDAATSGGHTVVVSEGTYQGFIVSNSGENGNEILITTNRNNVIINQAASGVNDNIYISNSDDVIIEGFTVINAPAYGIGTHDASSGSPMERVTIRYNTVSNSNSTNIYISNSRNSLALGNIAFDSLTSHGIYVANGGADDTDVIGNVLFGNQKNGLHFNGDGSGDQGIHTGMIVSGNTIYDNTANGIDADGVSDSSFFNNLIYNNGRHGIRVFVIDAENNGSSENLAIYNNTIVLNNSAIKVTDGNGGHSIFNNILMENSESCISLAGNNDLNTDISDNLYSSNCSFELGTSYTAGQVISNTTLVFTDFNSDDYSIKATSPAIDAGLSNFDSIFAPSYDIEGIERNDGYIDIGAYEI